LRQDCFPSSGHCFSFPPLPFSAMQSLGLALPAAQFHKKVLATSPRGPERRSSLLLAVKKNSLVLFFPLNDGAERFFDLRPSPQRKCKYFFPFFTTAKVRFFSPSRGRSQRLPFFDGGTLFGVRRERLSRFPFLSQVLWSTNRLLFILFAVGTRGKPSFFPSFAIWRSRFPFFLPPEMAMHLFSPVYFSFS